MTLSADSIRDSWPIAIGRLAWADLRKLLVGLGLWGGQLAVVVPPAEYNVG